MFLLIFLKTNANQNYIFFIFLLKYLNRTDNVLVISMFLKSYTSMKKKMKIKQNKLVLSSI